MPEKTYIRILFSLTLSLSGIFLLHICSVSAAAQNPIRIGATVSLEGKYTSLSYMVKNGYELWVDEINKRGGLLDRKVELVLYDDKSDKELATQLYEKLITVDKVDLVLSPYGSPLTIAAAEVTDRNGYVLLAGSASSTEIWQQGFTYVFGVYSTADRYFLGFLDLAAQSGMKQVAVIYEDSTFNISAASGVRKWAELFGLETIFFEKINDYKEDLLPIIKSLSSLVPDALIFCGYPPAGYHLLKLLEKQNFKPDGLAMTIIPAMPDFYNNVGPFAENIFGSSQWEADERLPFPGTAAFINSFLAKTGMKPSYQACSSYSACQILERAILQAGTIDHEKIRGFITNLDTVTIMGRFKVDFSGSQIGHNPILIQWQKGRKEIVYPTKMQTAPAFFPQP
ncbi:MAG: amino acid ABC transporter substrate-binding protein [Desulfopila sp.]|nr:amino acid ABC transporter substrate-binding protein [Desulfopila sp.]